MIVCEAGKRVGSGRVLRELWRGKVRRERRGEEEGRTGRQAARQTNGRDGGVWRTTLEMEMAQTTTRVNGKGLWQIPTFPLDSA